MIAPRNITKHPIEGVKCNCGMQGGKYSICPVDYERADTDYGPVARLRCPCGARTQWHLRAYPGDLADEWVRMQAQARRKAITATLPTDHRERKIRDLERRCRELEWAREEAEVYEWGRREMGKMADEIDDLKAKNADYIKRLLACRKAAESAEANLTTLRQELDRLLKALRSCLLILEERHGQPSEWADVQETTRTANARAAILLARHVLGKDAATARKGGQP